MVEEAQAVQVPGWALCLVEAFDPSGHLTSAGKHPGYQGRQLTQRVERHDEPLHQGSAGKTRCHQPCS